LTFPYVIIIIIYVPIFYDDNNESECSGEIEKEMTAQPVESTPENNSFKNIYEKILQTISGDDGCSIREKKTMSVRKPTATASSPIPIPFLRKNKRK
jgi:hypothetical protein